MSVAIKAAGEQDAINLVANAYTMRPFNYGEKRFRIAHPYLYGANAFSGSAYLAFSLSIPLLFTENKSVN